jgi:acetoin utilization deacetylase AcuC-like enzyme
MEDLVFYYPQGHAGHFEPGHPERPERVEAICQALQAAGWWERYPHLEPVQLSSQFLSTVHRQSYLAVLQAACQRGANLDADTYTTPASWQLALNSAGGAVAVAQAVWQGQSRAGLALTRPPGHHALAGRGMGFCLLNNIAVAAEYLVSQPGGEAPPAERLAIIDLDLHHGNGTQDIFWQRGDVFYISTHQAPFYPGTGWPDEVGYGPGEGYTANFPLPPFSGDEAFQTIMRTLILPLLDRFNPQMLLVSFGFDPHWRDPLGNLYLSAQVYGTLISDLAAWADSNCAGKIALFLEGGYDLDAGKACAQTCLAALLKIPWRDSLGYSPQPETSGWQQMVRSALKMWNL